MNYIHIYVCLCTYAEPNASANSLNPLVLNEFVYIFSVADRESLSADVKRDSNCLEQPTKYTKHFQEWETTDVRHKMQIIS